MERDANALYCVFLRIQRDAQLLFQPFPAGEQKLCQLLAEEGYAVSRRTVAKYREELGVSSAVGRRA